MLQPAPPACICPTSASPSASATIIGCTTKTAWISLNCNFGTFANALQQSHPQLRTTPFLLAKPHSVPSSSLSSLFPYSTVTTKPIHKVVQSITNALPSNISTPDSATSSNTITATFLQHNTNVTGLDWFCPQPDPSSCRVWLRSAFCAIANLGTSHQLRCAVLFARTDVAEAFPDILLQHSPPGWSHTTSTLQCPNYGDAVAASRWLCVFSRNNAIDAARTHEPLSAISENLLAL